MTENTFEKYELLLVLAALNEYLLHAVRFIIHTRLGDANELAAEARVQDPDSYPTADRALHITKAHEISWHNFLTK